MRHEFKKGTLEQIQNIVNLWIDNIAAKIVNPVTKSVDELAIELRKKDKL